MGKVSFAMNWIGGTMQGKSAGATYRVHTPLVALKYVSDSGSQFVTIPRGATIRVTGERKELGLVEIQYEGEALAIFRRDIEKHADQV
jgi:hypothetical protein